MDNTPNPFANSVIVEDDTKSEANPFANAVVVEDIEKDIEEDAVLPNPNTTMYDDIEGTGEYDSAFDAAKELYNRYKNDPNSQTNTLGQTTYNNRIVPVPSRTFFSDGAKVSFADKLAGGFQEGVSNIVETGAIATDAIFGRDDTTYLDENVANLSPGDSALDSVIIEGTAIMAGGLGMAAGVQKLISTAPKLASVPFVRSILGFVGFDIGASITANENAGTLVVGENSLRSDMGFGKGTNLDGFPVNPESPAWKNEAAKRANILLDGLMIAKLAEGTLEAVDASARLIYNLSPLANLTDLAKKSVREEMYVKNVLDVLSAGSATEEARKASSREIARLIKENQEIYVNMPKELAEDFKVSVDTMTALERGLELGDDALAANIIKSANKIKQGVVASPGGSNLTELKVAKPGQELESTLGNVEQTLGGGQAINDANTALQNQGFNQVDTANTGLAVAQDNLANADAVFAQNLKNDPSIVGKVARLEKAVGINIGSVRELSADAIVQKLSQAAAIMGKTKDDLYNAIEGGDVDYSSMVETLLDLRPQQLDAAMSATKSGDQFGTLLEQTKLRTNLVDGKPVQETVPEMKQRVSAWAQSKNLDFARLYTDIRPNLVESISRMEQGSPEAQAAASTLIKFKQWIDTDALQHVMNSGDPMAAEKAGQAFNYYKNEYAPFWRDGSTLEELDKLRTRTVARNMQPQRFADESRQNIKATIGDENREVSKNIVSLLSRVDGGGSSSDVLNMIKGDVLSKLYGKVDGSGADLGLNDARSALSSYATLIDEAFPLEAAKLEELGRLLSDSKLTKEQLQGEVTRATRLAEEAKDAVYHRELSKFFAKEGVPNPNGFDTMKKLFNNAQSADTLTSLVARAEQDPVILDGMRAAYTRWLKSDVFSSTASAGGDRTLSQAKQVQLEDGVRTNMLDYGNILFKDIPEYIPALNTIMEEVGLVQRSRNSKSIPTGSGTAETNAKIVEVNRAVTLIFGPLSRKGARVRTVASGYIQKQADPVGYLSMIDRLNANPQEFVDAAQRVFDKEDSIGMITLNVPGGVGKLQIHRDNLYQFMVRAGIYREGDPDDQRDLAERLAALEIGAHDAANSAKDAVSQTKDALLNRSEDDIDDIDAQTRTVVPEEETSEDANTQENDLGFVPKPNLVAPATNSVEGGGVSSSEMDEIDAALDAQGIDKTDESKVNMALQNLKPEFRAKVIQEYNRRKNQ
tara:strand:- start:354 stop:3992 length:3639 start_codon:yes stop_codon:yes gene_type:complete